MAIGFGRKPEGDGNASHDQPPQDYPSDPKPVLGNDGYGGWTPGADADLENGGQQPRRMSRIGNPITKSISASSALAADPSATLGKQIELEADNAIQYRTCSWQKTAALLFSEYIALAIMSFPYSYSVLGLVPGLILTVVVAAIVLYTSLVLWEFCLRHPEVKDVCDIGQMLFWNWRPAWYLTAVMFLLNNTFIQGLHCLVGAKYLNTISGDGRICTIAFSAIVAVIAWICSIPRTFNALSYIATWSAVFTFLSVLLAAIFAGIEDHPGGPAGYQWPTQGPVEVLVIPKSGTRYVDGMNAFLNIAYTFIGQITLPSFIAEMKEPRDFPKALWAVTISEIIVFGIVGGVIYGYTGTNYNTAPAFGSLGNETYIKISFSFMIPTLIFLGVLYASVSARFLFFRLFRGTRHIGNHTVAGWAGWIAILAVLWVLAFIIAEAIPFFSSLLSLMSSLFDSFFGFIFWGVAYIRMRNADYGRDFWKNRGIRGIVGFVVNVILIFMGLYILVAGTYSTVVSIIDGYDSGSFPGAFSCANNGF